MFPEIRTVALFTLHIAVATAVSVHVLLRKRDVGASISWIGLAFLAPVTGSLLYLIFGINRVRRRARRLQRPRLRGERGCDRTAREPPDGFEALGTAVERITERPLLDGNAAASLHDGDEAYPQMLAAIAAARSSVALTSYIFRADAVGRQFIDALAAAHRRGVAVRVLIDGIGGGWLICPAWRRLRREGVPAALFLHSWLPWRMTFLNLRSHRKLLVVDGRIAFTGGLNIGAENLAAAPARRRVRDTHFRLSGPVVAQLMVSFTEDWLFSSGETLEGEAWFPSIEAGGPALARVITSGPDHDVEKLEFVIMAALATARRSVRIATPYFLPDDRICSALELAAWRGVEVDIVIPRRSDHPTLDWATRAQIRPLLLAGCRIWTSAPPFNHAKLMSLDAVWSLVGSANWDVRSYRLNFEMDLELYDPDIAARVAATIGAGMQAPLTLDEIDARRLPVVLRDAAARLFLPYL